MDRPGTTASATGREIIQEILRNMREGLEPLQYSTLAPSIFLVYLHPDDHERLRGIAPRIVEEAQRALDAEIASLNRGSLVSRVKFVRREQPKVTAPEGGWQIRLLESTEEDAEPGDIVIHSELALPAKQDFGSGAMTKKIFTRRATEAVEAKYQEGDASALPPQPATVKTGGSGQPLAVLDYEDNSGHKQYVVTKDQIVVGRGGRDYWTDVKLETLPDVSREHFRLRRDPDTGSFLLKDLSRLGTTIDGERVPSSIEFAEGEKRDRNLEVPVPDQARIGLAGVIFLEFRKTPNG